MPASSSVRSKKAQGRSASSLARVLGRSEAGLSGARPCFWAARRATWLCAGVEREAAASAARLPVRGEPRAPPQAIFEENRGWRPSGTGLRPREPKTFPAWQRPLYYCGLVHSQGLRTPAHSRRAAASFPCPACDQQNGYAEASPTFAERFSPPSPRVERERRVFRSGNNRSGNY